MNNWEQIESAFGLLEEELGLLEKERAAKAAELAALDGQVSKARLLLGRMGGILTGEAPVAQCPEEHDLQERALQNGHTPPPAPPALATEPCCRIIAVSGQQLLLDPEDYEWAKNHRWYVRAGGGLSNSRYRRRDAELPAASGGDGKPHGFRAVPQRQPARLSPA